MSNLRKAVSMLLAVAMILSMCSIVTFADEATGEAATDLAVADETTNTEAADAVVGSVAASELASLPNDDVQYADDYKFDYALGLFELLSDGYWQKDQVTRADFATVVAKMIKANTAGYPRYGQTPYIDVDETIAAYPAICYLTEIGILQGDGNSEFRPNDPILVSEASKMIMCALGYAKAAETEGGFPTGYTTFALKAGIYNGISLSYSNSMTALEMARLVRNAMEAYLMESLTYNTDGSVNLIISQTKTLLSETYKLISATGTVTGTYYSYIDGSPVDLENEVTLTGVYADLSNEKNVSLGDVTYQFADTIDMEQYVGYQVDFYYMENVSGYRRNYIAYCEPREDTNTVYELDAKDITTLTRDTLVYTEANGRERTLNLSEAAVSFNGVPAPSKLTNVNLVSEEAGDARLTQGTVKVIAHDSASKAAAVIIQKQNDGLFEKYTKTTYKISFQNNMTSKLPELVLDPSSHVRLTLNGEQIEPEDLVKNDAITYSISEEPGTKYITAYVSRDVVSGYVSTSYTEQYSTGTYTVYTIEGEDYYKSTDFPSTININPGMDSDFQLTYNGRIIGTNSISGSNGNYGYLIDFGGDETAFDTRFDVKIMDMNGNVNLYRSASKVWSNYDGDDNAKTPKQIIDSGAFDSPMLVTYETNTAGEIRKLYMPVDYTNGTALPTVDGFGKYYSGTSSYNYNLLQEGNCAVTDNTVVFRVPFADRDHDEDYSIQTKEDLTESSYSVEVYDIVNGVANAIVIKDANPTSISETAGVLVLSKPSAQAWDSDQQQAVTELTGYSKGEEISLKVDDDCTQTDAITGVTGLLGSNIDRDMKDVKDLKVGDVIQYITNAQGYILSYRVLFNTNLLSGDDYFEIADGVSSETSSIYSIATSQKIRTVYGQVLNAYDYFMTATSDLSNSQYYRAYPTTDIELYIYDGIDDEVIVGEPYDIQADDKVFIKANSGLGSLMVVVYQDID